MKHNGWLLLALGFVLGVVAVCLSGSSMAPDKEQVLSYVPNTQNDLEGSQWVRKVAPMAGRLPPEMREMHIMQQTLHLTVQATERFCRDRKSEYRMHDVTLAVDNGKFFFRFVYDELAHVRPR